jgi:hypothetical protein
MTAPVELPHVVVRGWPLWKGTPVVVAFSNEHIVCLVGLVGTVHRWDSDEHGVRLWLVDDRTGHVVGPVAERYIDALYPVDGAWQTDAEVRDVMDGQDPDDEYSSRTDCGPAVRAAG